MIAAYLDESFDQQPSGVYAVGGLLGRGPAIFELERRWEKVRTRGDIDIEYFKAFECEQGTNQFAKFVIDPSDIPAKRQKLHSLSQEFLNAIVNPPFDKSHLFLTGVGVIQKEFYEAIQDDRAKAILGDTPYRLAYDLAMVQCAWAMKELGTGDNVAFVVDEHAEHSPQVRQDFDKLKTANPIAAKYLGTMSTEDDKTNPAIQAADAVIFEIRRALNLSLGNWKGQLRKQFSTLTDSGAMFLITHTNKAQLDHIISAHEPGETFRLDQLMDMKHTENIKLTLST